MAIDPQALRRMVAGFESAAREARRAEPAPGTPDEAFAAAVELWELRPELFTEPPDPIRERGVAEARGAWARLRALWGVPGHG
jgi:hypothetical protein